MVAKEKELNDHQRLMKGLFERTGPIPDGQAQGQAAKWLIEHGYSVEESLEYLDLLLASKWREGKVSLLNVKSEIGSHRARHKPVVAVKTDEEAFSKAEAERLVKDLIEYDAVGFSRLIEQIRTEYGIMGA